GRDGALNGVNASGWAPAALTAGAVRAKGFTGMPQSGADAVTVPGAVAGWSLLFDRFTHIPFADILAPAIALADEGFPVSEITATEWTNAKPFLHDNARAAGTFLPGGRAPGVGEVFRNADLASTYRRIVEHGTE